MNNEVKQGKVTVYSQDLRNSVLLDSDKAGIIAINDVYGDPLSLFIRLSHDVWGLSTKGDADWDEVLVRYGFKDLKDGVTLREALEDGVSGHLEEQRHDRKTETSV